MPKLDLTQLFLPPRHLAMLQDILRQHLNSEETSVWAYGSRVTGGAHEGSDLDLVVRNLANLNSSTPQLAALKEALTESNLPMLIDLHDWALLPEEFQQNIMQNYIEIT